MTLCLSSVTDTMCVMLWQFKISQFLLSDSDPINKPGIIYQKKQEINNAINFNWTFN